VPCFSWAYARCSFRCRRPLSLWCHGQCDARLTVICSAAGHIATASWPVSYYTAWCRGGTEVWTTCPTSLSQVEQADVEPATTWSASCPLHHYATPDYERSQCHKLQLGYWRKQNLVGAHQTCSGRSRRTSVVSPACLTQSFQLQLKPRHGQSPVHRVYYAEITSHFRCPLTIVAERDCARVLREISGWVSLLRSDDVPKVRVNEATPSTVRQRAAVWRQTDLLDHCLHFGGTALCVRVRRATRSRLTQQQQQHTRRRCTAHCTASRQQACHCAVITQYSVHSIRSNAANQKFVSGCFLPSI